MGTYSVSVKKAISGEQDDLIENGSHCSADPEKLATVGRGDGDQVRVVRSSTQYALYTVSQVRQESPDKVVRMGLAGRKRLGTTSEFAGTLDGEVARLNISDADAEATSEFVERLDGGDATGLVALAPHGGMIENYTDEQAERMHAKLIEFGKSAASWRCKGWKEGGGAYDRWHITSTELSRASFPLLDQIGDNCFTYAVAFHGMGDDNIVVGGAAPDALKQEVKGVLEAVLTGSGIVVRVAEPGDPLAGASPDNVVNWITNEGIGGVQIEQCYAARSGYWQEIADALALLFAGKL